MTDLGPDFVRARTKDGKPVVIHRSGLNDNYIAESPTPEEAAAIDRARLQPSLDASVKAHEAASVMAENERAAATKHAADERTKYEAASAAKLAAAAQAAADQQDIDRASAEAAVKVTEQKAAAKKAPK